ncbi:hypothetical protein JCM19297_919 [Nonlabens ulvanivorans]|nr:hypothetical protein [Nonlabens ulvanivorans]GAK91420.1 hypothetical protein JCM19297_919 [Nonlabens ulvanivorans]
MENFVEIIFSNVNIVLTVAIGILFVYWVLTAISGIDFNLDFDVDIDLDIDVDADFDVDITDGGNMDFQDAASAEIDKNQIRNSKRRKPLKWWQVILVYFNFVGLPFMFTFTVWFFTWWSSTIIITSLTGSENNTFGFIIMFGLLIPALILTKIITTPFKFFFKNVNKDGDKPVDFLGREALLLSSISGDKLGNAEVMAEGNLMSIYVKSLDGSELRFRESVLIIKQSQDKNYFLVSKS